MKRRIQRLRLALVPAFATMIIACSSPIDPGELSQMQKARARWETRGFQDYSFVTRVSCFCAPPTTLEVQVVVVDGLVVSVKDFAADSLLDTGYFDSWYTIDELFDRIPHLTSSSYLNDLELEFDAALGYPTYINTVYDDGIADAGVTYVISKLTAQ